MQSVIANSTVLKYLKKVKLTNILQHIQVHKSREKSNVKNSRKL